MTPEQMEQWQKAISPIDYLDFHALTENGLLESEERLTDWSVPGWAMQLRGYIITQGWKVHETWTPGFALRSETALIGLQLRYPTSDPRVEVYRHVLLRFLYEALTPIAMWALEGDEVRRNGYQALVRVQDLCQRVLQTSYPPSSTERVAWNRAIREILDRKGRIYLDEIYSSVELATHILVEWQDIVFFPERWPAWWSRLRSLEVENLVNHLHYHHQRRLEEKGDATTSYEVIAAVYLTALEAECPPPLWVPKE